MHSHKINYYKLSAVKYYLSHSKNQEHTCKIYGFSRRFKCSNVVNNQYF